MIDSSETLSKAWSGISERSATSLRAAPLRRRPGRLGVVATRIRSVPRDRQPVWAPKPLRNRSSLRCPIRRPAAGAIAVCAILPALDRGSAARTFRSLEFRPTDKSAIAPSGSSRRPPASSRSCPVPNRPPTRSIRQSRAALFPVPTIPVRPVGSPFRARCELQTPFVVDTGTRSKRHR